MNRKTTWQTWRWLEAPVERMREHFELRYGSAEASNWDAWLPVALVGRPSEGAFRVQFLIDRADARNASIARAVMRELDFYLVEKQERDPWAYAQYHCGTAANIYSSVHWSFFPNDAAKSQTGSAPGLPDRYALCEPPTSARRRMADRLIPSEESATLWLWAWPHLLGWPYRLNWLFSPVTGNDRHPGDLWGVDSRGDLVMVETKIDRRQRGQNPFQDFLPFAQTPSAPHQHHLDASSLRNRWQALLAGERKFLRQYGARLQTSLALKGCYPGIVPYSFHRKAVCEWCDVYLRHIRRTIENATYERAVQRSLRYRAARGNPPPFFVGLVATVRIGEPAVLSSEGQECLNALRQRAGSPNVILRAIRATLGPKRLRIRCWTPELSRLTTR